MGDDSQKHPVLQALEELVAHQSEGNDPAESIQLTVKVMEALMADPENGEAVLNVALDHSDPKARIMACFLFSELTRWGITVDQQYKQRAEETVLRVLRHGKPEEQFVLCSLFSVNGGLSKAAISAVEELTSDTLLPLRISAAAALCGSHEVSANALSALREGLASNVEPLVALASNALGQLAQLGIRKAEALELLIAGLNEPNSARQALAVVALGKIDSLPQKAILTLTKLAKDETREEGVRAAAVIAVAKATQGTDVGHPLFLKLLGAREWQIVHQSMNALASSDNIPPGTAKRLIPQLSAPNELMRRAAAMGVAATGSQAREILPSLLLRLDVESNVQVIGPLAEAIAAAGDDIVPILKERIMRGESTNLVVAVRALCLLENSPIAELVIDMLHAPQPSIQAVGVEIVETLGTTVASAVPRLSAMLEEADNANERLLRSIISALAACGTAGREAIGPVVRRLQIATDETALVAMRFLRDMGPDAATEINRVMPHAPGLAERRLQAALREIGGTPLDRFALLRNIKERLLVTVAAIGDLLEREGALGFDSLERLIDEGKNLEFRPESYSSGTLRSAITELEKLLRQKILIREQGKSSRLTPYGRDFLHLVREYLRSRQTE